MHDLCVPIEEARTFVEELERSCGDRTITVRPGSAGSGGATGTPATRARARAGRPHPGAGALAIAPSSRQLPELIDRYVSAAVLPGSSRVAASRPRAGYVCPSRAVYMARRRSRRYGRRWPRRYPSDRGFSLSLAPLSPLRAQLEHLLIAGLNRHRRGGLRAVSPTSSATVPEGAAGRMLALFSSPFRGERARIHLGGAVGAPRWRRLLPAGAPASSSPPGLLQVAPHAAAADGVVTESTVRAEARAGALRHLRT